MIVQILDGTISWNGKLPYSGSVWQICFEFTDSILQIEEARRLINEAVSKTDKKVIITPFVLPYLVKHQLMYRKGASASYERLIAGLQGDAIVCMPFANFDVDLISNGSSLHKFSVVPKQLCN